MLEQKEYRVQLIVSTAHEYVVTARTEEEAISTAEGMLDDGEEGEILSTEVEMGDAYLYSDEEEEEEQDEEEEGD